MSRREDLENFTFSYIIRFFMPTSLATSGLINTELPNIKSY
jgi:hypothetical protein